MRPVEQPRTNSMNTQTSSTRDPAILVSGDLTNDHFVYTGERFNALDLQGRGVVRRTTPGGVALLHRLLAEVFDDKSAAAGGKPKNVFSKMEFSPIGSAETAWEGYALWEPCAGVGKDNK